MQEQERKAESSGVDAIPPETVNLFYVRSGFEYFFATALIDHLDLDQVVFVLNEPREGIENRIAERFRTIHTKDGFARRFFGKKVGKLVFVKRVFEELALAGKNVNLFSPVFNETFIDGLRNRIEQACPKIGYFLTPDGAALLRHLPRRPERRFAIVSLIERTYRIVPADRRHTSGSYSGFLSRIYHYPAKRIYAPAEKIEIIPVPVSDKHHNGEILVIGGLDGISRAFVGEARRIAGDARVRYRMHPRNRSGEEFIHEIGGDWTELEIEGVLEEHLLDSPYRLVLGSYSTSLMFNHLFVSNSESRFLVDRERDDPDWHATADACGIPVSMLDP